MLKMWDGQLVSGQLVKKYSENKRTDTTDCITFSVNAVG